MKRLWSGFSTVEVMIMLVAISLIIFAAYGAKSASYQFYREIIHRERAQLWLTETFEIMEAMRLTSIQQDYLTAWKDFIGTLEGDFKLVKNDTDPGYSLVSYSPTVVFADDDLALVKIYENDEQPDGIYSRLERRISIEDFPGTAYFEPGVADQKIVTCSIFWGVSGGYDPDSIKQVSMEVLYSDDTLPAFAL